MTEDTLRYDIWVEEALRSVIQKTIAHVADHGLPGDHHFYISFLTQDSGVQIPARLRAQHPNDMTIVLQHQFENLAAGEDSFSITLSFGGKKEDLVIPYASVISFADPSVNFALQLKMLPLGDDDEEYDEDDVEDYDSRHLDYFEETRNRTNQDDRERGLTDDDEPKTGEVITLDAFRKK
ncbi:SspB family protein [Magnetovibrio sp.]|uniref:SspB family protein n=1 Tax=Magnetovibrio sp. TaxID=2024836 RepID=UPI002F921755